MRILIFGGTVFLGRHIVEAALARGHEVTAFTRGQHGADLFPGIEKLRGDRDGDLSALDGHAWDAVIDTSGYAPRIVRRSAEAVKDKARHYTFISTLSVYPDMTISGINEETPVATMEDKSVEEVTGETYGPLFDTCKRVSGSDATFTWIPEQELLGRGAGPWMEVPLWMPAADWAGFDAFDVSKAVSAGLTFRPLEVTVRDTLAWDTSRPADYEFKAGMSRERERELLSREP